MERLNNLNLYLSGFFNASVLKRVTLLAGMVLCTWTIAHSQTVFSIDVNEKAGANHSFWKAAGHDYMFSMTEDEAGEYIFSRIKEHNTVKYIRTHFTFSNDPLEGGNIVVFHEDGSYHYDFSRVNHAFRCYIEHGMRPIVEFGFFPKGFAKSLGGGLNSEGFNSRQAEPRDWNEWETLIRAFMDNMINTFAHIVKSYDEGFRVGGPAMFKLQSLKPFLDHVSSGINYVTGKKGSPIDFISYHIYGLSGSWLKSTPELTPLVSRFSQELL